jgi:hypothetical protein
VSIVGRTYLERGEPVVVLVQWGPGGGPRNVKIRRADGTVAVRPFRGLRRADTPCLRGDQ